MNTHHLINANCIDAMKAMTAGTVDLILTDPPYITRYKSRDGRTVPNDDNDAWLEASFAQMFRILKRDAFCISFYGWSKVDLFASAWRRAGFRIGGHIVFRKRYTSKAKRLNRPTLVQSRSFGDESYSKEELVAEIGSWLLSAQTGIPHDPAQHAAYVAHWIKALKEDKNEIFRAASAAHAATDHLMGLDRSKAIGDPAPEPTHADRVNASREPQERLAIHR